MKDLDERRQGSSQRCATALNKPGDSRSVSWFHPNSDVGAALTMCRSRNIYKSILLDIDIKSNIAMMKKCGTQSGH